MLFEGFTYHVVERYLELCVEEKADWFVWRKNLLLLSKWPAKSQLSFSRTIEISSLVENIRSHDAVGIWAGILRDESKQFDFKLDGNLKLVQDLASNYNSFKVQGPPLWEKFFNAILPYRNIKKVRHSFPNYVFNHP